jgi:hypothetical protein
VSGCSKEKNTRIWNESEKKSILAFLLSLMHKYFIFHEKNNNTFLCILFVPSPFFCHFPSFFRRCRPKPTIEMAAIPGCPLSRAAVPSKVEGTSRMALEMGGPGRDGKKTGEGEKRRSQIEKFRATASSKKLTGGHGILAVGRCLSIGIFTGSANCQSIRDQNRPKKL